MQNFDPAGRNLLVEPGEANRQWDTVAKGNDELWGKDGFGFDDFVDLINPLQHIPIVSTIYRALTGDKLEPGARLLGGVLFGGPIGFAGAMLNTVVEYETGGDVGENIIAMINGKQLTPPKNNNIQLAQTNTAAAAKNNTNKGPTPVNSDTVAGNASVTTIPKIAPGQAMFLPKSSAENLGKYFNTANGNKSVQDGTIHSGSRNDQHSAAMRAATGKTQRLSPNAFDALMKSIGAVKIDPNQIDKNSAKNAVAGAPSSQLHDLLQQRQLHQSQQLAGAGGKQLPVLKHGAAMELHRILKNHAQKAPLPSGRRSAD